MSCPTPLVELFFAETSELGDFEPIDAGELPDAFRSLLAHDDHMTVTLEAWHNSLVDVNVLAEHVEGDRYARQILLSRQRDGEVVQFGVMRIDLAGLPEIARLEVQSQALPLGRIMIRHHLHREVEMEQLWRIKPGPALMRRLDVAAGDVTYGRTARILVEGKPAVELLEIVKL